MNPEHNIELAKVLARAPRGAPEEASFRAACGRAYYAAFVVARDSLLSARIRVGTDGSVHHEISEMLKESTNEEIRTAGWSLDRLRRTRNRADYEVGLRSSAPGVFNQQMSQYAVASASSIVQAIKKISISDPRLGISA